MYGRRRNTTNGEPVAGNGSGANSLVGDSLVTVAASPLVPPREPSKLETAAARWNGERGRIGGSAVFFRHRRRRQG